MKQRGFTVIELMALVTVLAIVGVVFWTQKSNLETAARDDKRKTAINAMHYGLEEVFYKTNAYYPKSLSSSTLPSVDPDSFKDPDGKTLGSADSDYRYEGKRCTDDKCKSYSLRTTLENESDFVKDSRNE